MSVTGISSVLKSIVGEVNKVFDEKTALSGDEECLSDVLVKVPTRSFLFNLLLGGGVPLGRVIELYGDSSDGKSSLGQEIMTGFQMYPGISVLIDSEFTWDRARAKRMGHSEDKHILVETTSLEKGVEVVDSLITKIRTPGKGVPSTMPMVVVWDTISNSGTSAEVGVDEDDGSSEYKNGMCDKPRKLRALERKWSHKLPKLGCSLIFISQTYTGPQRGSFTPQKKTSGGAAIKFWASKRIKVWKTSSATIDYPYKGAGIIISASTVKDKLNPPFRQIELPLMFDNGVHPGYELVNYLLDHDKKKRYLYKDKSSIVLKAYPEPDKEFAFGLKEMDPILKEIPTMLDYLRLCTEIIWKENNL